MVNSMVFFTTYLKEVDDDHYTRRLRVSMKELGYEGVLLRRRDDQGLATFWRSSVFQLITTKHAALHHLAEAHLQVFLSPCIRCLLRQ